MTLCGFPDQELMDFHVVDWIPENGHLVGHWPLVIHCQQCSQKLLPPRRATFSQSWKMKRKSHFKPPSPDVEPGSQHLMFFFNSVSFLIVTSVLKSKLQIFFPLHWALNSKLCFLYLVCRRSFISLHHSGVITLSVNTRRQRCTLITSACLKGF